jgi:pilus assembly protein CpaB
MALIAAGGTAYLARQFLAANTQTQTVEAPKQESIQATILVADQNLPAGAVLSASSLHWQPWPEDSISPDYIVSANDNSNRADLEQQFIETVARRGIAEGTPITSQLVFRRDAPGFLAGVLEPGTRAVAVPVTAATGAAGFVLPGDHVDVMLTHDVRRDLQQSGEKETVIADSLIRYTSETIVQNLRVLAIDQRMNDFEDTAAVVRTVTLQVTPKQAQTLNVALAMGDLSVSLRSLALDEDPNEDRTFTTDLQVSPTLAYALQSRVSAEQLALVEAQAANARSATRQAAQKTVAPSSQIAGARVKVYRGGRTSTQEFRTR